MIAEKVIRCPFVMIPKNANNDTKIKQTQRRRQVKALKLIRKKGDLLYLTNQGICHEDLGVL